jgi:hypothetical protein
VQGRSEDQRQLSDVQGWVGHLLPPGGVFAFLAEHRGELFPDELFADLFPSGRGRPSVPADVVATVIVLQALNGLSDREAAEAVTFDLRWKAAAGLTIQANSFHPTTLTYWRRRLAASDRPNRIFDVVREVVAQTGALRGKSRRVLDSTVLDDAVATQDTVTQLIAAIRRVARIVPGAPAVIVEVCHAHDYDDPGKPRIAWDDEQARAQLVDGLVGDARRLLAKLADGEDDRDPAQTEALALLALIAGQDVEWIPDPDLDAETPAGGRWAIARRVAPDRVISVIDPDSRHAHKTTSRRQDGFKAHVVVEPDTGLVTACAVTRAAGEGSGDAAAGQVLLATDTTIADGESVQVLGDSAYGTGPMLAALAAAGHQALVKPWPVTPAVPGGFTVDDFTVDHTARTATCPAGVTRRINPDGQVNFGIACRGCPFRDRCTRSRKGKSLHVREHEALRRAHRRNATAPTFLADYRQYRPAVERSLAWLTRGNRKLRYRGTTKNDAWFHLRAGAINLRRLLTLGLHRDNSTWKLA